jgi:hypothetical protein
MLSFGLFYYAIYASATRVVYVLVWHPGRFVALLIQAQFTLGVGGNALPTLASSRRNQREENQERWGFPVPQIDDGSIIPRATDSVTVNSSFDFSDIGICLVRLAGGRC